MCDMCMCLARGAIGGERIGFGWGLGYGRVGCCYVCMRCEFALFV